MLDIDALAEETKKLLTEADWFAERADSNRWAAAKNTYIACVEQGTSQREWARLIGKSQSRWVHPCIKVWREFGLIAASSDQRRSFEACFTLVKASEERREEMERISSEEGIAISTADKRLRARQREEPIGTPMPALPPPPLPKVDMAATLAHVIAQAQTSVNESLRLAHKYIVDDTERESLIAPVDELRWAVDRLVDYLQTGALDWDEALARLLEVGS